MITLTLHLTGLDPDGTRVAALVDAGFDDALITQDRAGDGGVVELDVDVDVQLDDELLRTLIRRAESVGGVAVVGVGPSPIVTAAEIAERLGRTRQSIGQLATGARGPGGWPPPVNPGTGAPLWEWGAVARWANRHLDAGIDDIEIATAETLAWVNTLLRLGDPDNLPEIDAPIRELARGSVHG